MSEMADTGAMARTLVALSANRIREMVVVRREQIDQGAVANGNLFLAGMWAAYTAVEADLSELASHAERV